MSKSKLSPGLLFFGNLVDLGCHVRDLELVLRKTEEIEFPVHDESFEGDSLIGDIFPGITRKSFIVTLLIALDDQFKIYCEILRDATNKTLKWNDLKGSALERFIAYSEKVCGIESVYEDAIRQDVVGLIEVRNCIVHNNSSLDGFNKYRVIEDFANRLDGLNIEDGYISLSFDACKSSADIVLLFMERAYNAALEVFPR